MHDTPEVELHEFELYTIIYGLNNCAHYFTIHCLHDFDTYNGNYFPFTNSILTRAVFVNDIVFEIDTKEQLLLQKPGTIGLLHSGTSELSR